MSTNVGLIILLMPKYSAKPCVKVVFPAPKSPYKHKTVPRGIFFAKSKAALFVSSLLFVLNFMSIMIKQINAQDKEADA